MFSDAKSFAEHLEALNTMVGRLSPLDIAVYQHNYDMLAFGNWTLVAGKRKERIKFLWDGREGFLTIEQAIFSDSQHNTKWEQIKIQGVNVETKTDVLDVVEQFLKTKFAV